MNPKVDEEKELCMQAAQRLADRRGGGTALLVSIPDSEERTKKAVDLIARDGLGEIVVEHTLLETFARQRFDDELFDNVVGGLAERLRWHLPSPGHYQLILAVGATVGKKDTRRLQESIVQWVIREAPRLPEPRIPPGPTNHISTTEPAEMTLYRLRDGPAGEIHIMRRRPADIEELSKARALKSLRDKVAKLLEKLDQTMERLCSC